MRLNDYGIRVGARADLVLSRCGQSRPTRSQRWRSRCGVSNAAAKIVQRGRAWSFIATYIEAYRSDAFS